MGVQWGYSGVQEGYSGGIGGIQEGYIGGTVGVQEKSIKQHNTCILFHIYCNIMYTMNNTTNEHGMICFTCCTFYDTNFSF